VAIAHQLCQPNGPYSKSQGARALGIARGTLYLQGKQAKKDKKVAVAIEAWHEKDDTMGHRKLAVLLQVGKNRVKRVMKKYGIAARRKRKKYVYPGKASSIVPNLLRDTDEQERQKMQEVVFSDLFEVSLADRTKVRGCFALCKRTRHILALAFEYHMRADLVVSTINMIQFPTSGTIFHSDQGSQYGAEQTQAALLEKGFIRSMSRAGTPTDNGYAERFVGVFKLAVAERRQYKTLGSFLQAAEDWINFYNQIRPHQGLEYRSPDQFAYDHGLAPSETLRLMTAVNFTSLQTNAALSSKSVLHGS
jgi:putative transposase